MGQNDSDTAWKLILDEYFKDFVEYCLPELYGLINWDRHWQSLDQELQVITKGSESGKRFLDKLFKVYLKDGQEQWILIHLEVQAREEDEFPKRMFTYGYRIYDKYQKPIASCAILTDESESWRPSSYRVGVAGSYLSAEYLVVKIIDYYGREGELDASRNPFASVILSQLEALKVKRSPDLERKHVKFALTKRWYEKGFSKEQVINLFTFLDWLIGLSQPLELEYKNELHELEVSKHMRYVTSIERMGIEQGKAEGKAEEKIDTTRILLKEGASFSLVEKVTGFSLDKIKELAKSFVCEEIAH